MNCQTTQTKLNKQKAITNETALFPNCVLLLLIHLIYPIARDQSLWLETLVDEGIYNWMLSTIHT